MERMIETQTLAGTLPALAHGSRRIVISYEIDRKRPLRHRITRDHPRHFNLIPYSVTSSWSCSRRDVEFFECLVANGKICGPIFTTNQPYRDPPLR